MEKSTFGSVFMQATRMSFIKTKVQQKKGSTNDTFEQGNIDDKSMRLLRNHHFPEQFVVLKRRGMLFTSKQETGMFACFCGKKRSAQDVELINRKLTVRKGDRFELHLNFNTVRVELQGSGGSFQLVVHATNPDNIKKFYFEAQHSEDGQAWRRDLNKAIEGSDGKQYPLSYLTSLEEYWKTPSITEDEFSRTCDSGDVLLFKSTHSSAKFQRAITASEYDHVAVVLKNQKGEVLLFQSNSGSGVAFTFWKDLVHQRWYESVEKVVYRKLNLQRTEAILQLMEEFIVENLDKEFKLDIGKIFKFTSTINPTAEQKKNRTYFCSELVAALYKKMGLLEPETSCTQYYPVHFSNVKNLALLKGTLSPEQTISFDLQTIDKKYKR